MAQFTAEIERDVAGLRRSAPFLALDGFPISGDDIKRFIYDPHPTQPFRMGDVLWPLLKGEER